MCAETPSWSDLLGQHSDHRVFTCQVGAVAWWTCCPDVRTSRTVSSVPRRGATDFRNIQPGTGGPWFSLMELDSLVWQHTLASWPTGCISTCFVDFRVKLSSSYPRFIWAPPTRKQLTLFTGMRLGSCSNPITWTCSGYYCSCQSNSTRPPGMVSLSAEDARTDDSITSRLAGAVYLSEIRYLTLSSKCYRLKLVPVSEKGVETLACWWGRVFG